MGVDPRLTHGERRRREILATALDLGSVEGLESLTIGRLAAATGMSKSGLFAHFGSKQELQLAAVERAQADFERRVLEPPQRAEPGLARLRALLGAWLDYVERIEFRGGCFFFQTTSEYGSRSGPVHDRLAQLALAWIRSLRVEASVAVRQRELAPGTDPEQLVFGLHAAVQEANWARELLGDARAFERARTAIAAALAAAAVSPTP
jgi:AcrR family transcriptional regulator